MSDFHPYENNSQQISIRQMRIDNGTDEITISGPLNIPRSKKGLEIAKKLAAVSSDILAALSSEKDLPDSIQETMPETGITTENPFS